MGNEFVANVSKTGVASCKAGLSYLERAGYGAEKVGMPRHSLLALVMNLCMCKCGYLVQSVSVTWKVRHQRMLTHHFFKGLVHGLFLVLVEHEGVGVPIYSKIGKGDQLRQQYEQRMMSVAAACIIRIIKRT